MREARRLKLPVIALVDTNCDPDEASHVIPGNDDAIRSCALVIKAIADGIEEGKQKVSANQMEAARVKAEAAAAAAAAEPEPEPGVPEPEVAVREVEAEDGELVVEVAEVPADEETHQ